MPFIKKGKTEKKEEKFDEKKYYLHPLLPAMKKMEAQNNIQL